MDPNLLRHLGYMPASSQTAQAPRQKPENADPLDEGVDLSGSGTVQNAQWDMQPKAFVEDLEGMLVASPEETRPPTSRTPSTLSIDTIAAQASPTSQQRRAILTPRTRTREGNERKRSKLTTESTPFDSVDYWIQFDNDDASNASPNPASPELRRNSKTRNPAPQRSIPLAQQSVPSGSGSFAPFTMEQAVDDSALDNALSDEEEGLSTMNLAEHLSGIESAPPTDIPPREGLYSTPLSWEKPQMGLRIDSLIGLQNPVLTEAEQRRLIAMAMNTGTSMGGLGGNMSSAFGGLGLLGLGGQGTTTMSEVTNSAPYPRPTERASSPRPRPSRTNTDKGKDKERAKDKCKDKDADHEKEKPKPGDRSAHNDIERKYRTNLKDRIAELRDAVPSLRGAENPDDDDGDSTSQKSRAAAAAAAKVSKGTVLTKATEYIQQLEKKNRTITKQHQELTKRLQALEQLLAATARPAYTMPSYSRTLFDPRAFC